MDAGGAGRNAVAAAFYEIFSIKDAFESITMAGKTDIQIIKEGISLHGLSLSDGILPSLLSIYLSNLRTEIRKGKGRLKPGVTELLEALSNTEDNQVGLLTGNIAHGARIKLGAFGLNRYFPDGAFGDDDEDRNKLLPIAVEKFRKLGNIDFLFRDCIVVGDTPMDVRCSKPFGATSIAVATGLYDRASLLEAGADYVLADLTSAIDLIDKIGWRSR
jgi:phosphoglycolate phosphatase-like HAD superfamily hydrolase